MRVNTFITALVLFFLLVSCKKNGDGEGACGAGYDDVLTGFFRSDISKLTTYSGTVVKHQLYYNYAGGSPNKVTFFTGVNAKAICTEEHMKIDFEIIIENNPTVSM